jgi:hypothetical protein
VRCARSSWSTREWQGASRPGLYVQVERRRRKQQGVDAIENPAVSRNNPGAVLDSSDALEPRLKEVAADAESHDSHAEQCERKAARRRQQRWTDLDDEKRGQHDAANRPFDGLLGTDRRRQRPPAKETARVELR